MSAYDEGRPLRELQAMKQTLAARQADFTDVDGNPLDLGYPVQYVHDRTTDQDIEDGVGTVWNPERWGIVIDLIHTPEWDYEKRVESETEFTVQVKVAHPNIITDRRQDRDHDVFTCDVKSVRVIQ